MKITVFKWPDVFAEKEIDCLKGEDEAWTQASMLLLSTFQLMDDLLPSKTTKFVWLMLLNCSHSIFIIFSVSLIPFVQHHYKRWRREKAINLVSLYRTIWQSSPQSRNFQVNQTNGFICFTSSSIFLNQEQQILSMLSASLDRNWD